jgi:hypothetical protein
MWGQIGATLSQAQHIRERLGEGVGDENGIFFDATKKINGNKNSQGNK